jgi:hypothetical protein
MLTESESFEHDSHVLETPHHYIAPFSLLIPVPLEMHFHAGHNQAATIFKAYIKSLTGDVLPKNTVGHMAAGLVLGSIDQVKPKKSPYYSMEGDGRGITFHDPETLYCRWMEVEKKVGRKKQTAMRNLIDNRANTQLHFSLLRKYIDLTLE